MARRAGRPHQYGSSARDQLNVGDKARITINNSPARPVGATAVGDAAKKTGGVGMLVVAAVLGVIYLLSDADEGRPDDVFPAQTDPLPPGLTTPAVTAAAASGLRSCVREVVLQPVNCPQSVDESYPEDAEDVSWSLHGDPTDGARVSFQSSTKRFQVVGNAIMSADYTILDERKAVTLPVPYLATFTWEDGRLIQDEIRRFSGTADPPIVKTDPAIPRNRVLSLVAAEFRRCAAVKSAPMPPRCPQPEYPEEQDHASWVLNGDPVANARVSFDPGTGLTHVVGNYSATVRYKAFLDDGDVTHSGAYEALVAVDGGKPRVVQISGKAGG